MTCHTCVYYIHVGTYSQNIHIYDATTLQYVVQWTGHVGIINCIIVSPSGRFMFSSSSDSTVMVSIVYCLYADVSDDFYCTMDHYRAVSCHAVFYKMLPKRTSCVA